MLSLIKAISNMQVIFDFDGVILNSHIIKAEGFYQIFKIFGKNHAKQAQKYHLSKSGISRYKKFTYIKKNILKNNKIKNNQLNKNFKNYSLKKILNLKINAKLLKFLKSNYKKYEFYISTGSPQKEIIYILKKKKLYQFFRKVYGSPSTKIEHIKKIKKKNKKSIFIGDSLDDFKAAKKTSINFLLKIHRQNKKEFCKMNINKILNYDNLEKKILSILKKN
jgi:phosphoglycolate phosphatase-like HAD superfamily hydrolase